MGKSKAVIRFSHVSRETMKSKINAVSFFRSKLILQTTFVFIPRICSIYFYGFF